jgi:hypothetical protein
MSAGSVVADIKEDQLKAAYIYNFSRFVKWPKKILANTDVIRICTLQKTPLSGTLNELAGRPSQQKIIVIEHLDNSGGNLDISVCHILYTGKGASTQLATLKSMPVLVIGEHGSTTNSVDMIVFRIIDNKIRFDINLLNVKEGKLEISSSLLRLAINVVDN